MPGHQGHDHDRMHAYRRATAIFPEHSTLHVDYAQPSVVQLQTFERRAGA
jgi:hypothetical protein